MKILRTLLGTCFAAVTSLACVASDMPQGAIGICMAVPYVELGTLSPDDFGTFRVEGAAASYWYLAQKKNVAEEAVRDIKLVSLPKHGSISPYKLSGSGADALRYVPNPGFLGSDKAVYLAKVEGKSIRIEFHFKATKADIDRGGDKQVCKRFEWVIS
ncbi:MAG: hypothetical protein QM776_05830 [Rhodocyclaceae bacterium]